MTAPLHLSTVLDRITDGLQAVRMRISPPAIARLVDCDRSAVAPSRRPSDLRTWSSKDVFTLAAYDSAFREDVITALTEQHAAGEPLAAEADLRALVRAAGRTIEHTMERLEDQRLDPEEARASIPELRELRAAIDQAIRDCTARAKASRK